MPKITFPPNKEIAKLCFERQTNNVSDLSFKDLTTLSEESLKLLCAKYYFGDWWNAYKAKYKDGFKIFNHESWDINLSFLGGTRLCGTRTPEGGCPMPFEHNLDFWQRHRDCKFKDQQENT